VEGAGLASAFRQEHIFVHFHASAFRQEHIFTVKMNNPGQAQRLFGVIDYTKRSHSIPF
jgi:hypothetical protein